MSGRVRLVCGAALAAMLALPGAAQARTSVFVGVGGPVYPAYPHHHYYYPPPVYVAPPPPVVYVEPAPPPAVVFTQPAPQPMAVNPAGPAYVARSGQLCREYQSTVNIGGVPQQTHGTACQQPDGSWRIMN
ncbi:hypothetical protein [Azospirillum sp. sgz302134]